MKEFVDQDDAARYLVQFTNGEHEWLDKKDIDARKRREFERQPELCFERELGNWCTVDGLRKR